MAYQQEVSNWGLYPRKEARIVPVYSSADIDEALSPNHTMLPRGLGRSYGDSALSEVLLDMLPYDRFLSFDEREGILVAEGGISLGQILEYFVPKGWFLPVTPGTKYVTLGGALASDVHGKNHHSEGSISNHILEFTLMTEDGKIHTVTPREKEWFQATAGGMGLTGIILTVKIRLKKVESAYIKQNTYKAINLKHIFELFEQTKQDTYSVAWIDCLQKGNAIGRSVLMTGEHASAAEASQTSNNLATHKKPSLSIPLYFPHFALNTFSIKAFNWLYYHKNLRSKSENIVHYDPFFYPLDAILNWNKMYGKRGFTQYQFVIPKEAGYTTMHKILKTIAESGQGSFLAVLKLFGNQESLISFPMEGYTLALDFAIKPELFPLLDRLDKLVLEVGGRIYLTKDVRMTKDTFFKSYPHAEQFINICKSINPSCTFRSVQSDRLGITPW